MDESISKSSSILSTMNSILRFNISESFVDLSAWATPVTSWHQPPCGLGSPRSSLLPLRALQPDWTRPEIFGWGSRTPMEFKDLNSVHSFKWAMLHTADDQPGDFRLKSVQYEGLCSMQIMLTGMPSESSYSRCEPCEIVRNRHWISYC